MSILIENLWVHVSDKTLLHDIHCEIKAGTITAIIGENGAGKSTLLHSIAGTQNYTGSIKYNGVALEQYNTRDLAQTRAVLPQQSVLGFPLSVLDVVQLAMHLVEDNHTIIHEKALESLNLLKANTLIERDYSTLSGGEKQRVQLARVIAQLISAPTEKTQFLLLDEPTSALDLCHQFDFFQLVNELKDRNIGIVAILHDLNMASLFCDHLLVLKQGKILIQGEAKQVLQPDIIQTAFNIKIHVHQHQDNERPYLVPCLQP